VRSDKIVGNNRRANDEPEYYCRSVLILHNAAPLGPALQGHS